MTKINISGTIIHAPGPWGLNVPVANAAIRVFDRDLPGKQDELVLEASTDSEGRFSGEGAEWQDRLGPIADPSDAPMFSVEVTGSQGQAFTSPPLLVPPLFGSLAMPPIVVPWAPGDPVVVDGKTCWNPIEVFEAVAERAFGNKEAFEISVPDSAVPAVAAILKGSEERAR